MKERALAAGGRAAADRHPRWPAAVLNGMPIRAAQAGQLAGMTMPYSWILR